MLGYAEDALPFLAAWRIAYGFFDGRFVPTWLVGVTGGVLIRAAILSHWYVRELSFYAVALVFIGVLALTLRAASRTVERRRTAR